MKVRDHFTIDSTGLAVLAICLVGVVAVLVSVFWNVENPNLKVPVLIFGFSGVILNRILPPQPEWLGLD